MRADLLTRLISCDQNTLFLATPSARFHSAILCDGEGLSAEALGGAIRCVVGVDSIGRGLLPGRLSARAYLGRCCATLTHFYIQIEELNVGSSGPSGACPPYLACLTVLLVGILDVWTVALDVTQGK